MNSSFITLRPGVRYAIHAASQPPVGGPLMWMMPLHFHVNQKLDYDDENIFPGSNFMVQTTRCVVWGQDVFHINRYLVRWLHIRR